MNLNFKRIIAYLFDVLIITFISSALTYVSFINPKYDKYIKYTDQYNEAIDKL